MQKIMRQKCVYTQSDAISKEIKTNQNVIAVTDAVNSAIAAAAAHSSKTIAD